METVIAALVIVALVIFVIARTALVVPQQSAFVVENLGKYSRTLQAGFRPARSPTGRRPGGEKKKKNFPPATPPWGLRRGARGGG